MAHVITMPRLSDTMEEGGVAKWHKAVGDKVSEGDILAEIETDKAVQDFESEYDGVLLHIGVPEGKNAPVDSVLAVIGQEGEDISAALNSAGVSDEGDSSVNDDSEAHVENSSEPAEVPEGVEVITMPRLSDTMEEGGVAKWHKAVGDAVSEGDILAEIETDKAVQDFESEYDGTLLHIGVQEGSSAPVDSILAIIGPEGTDVSAIVAAGGIVSEKKEASPQPQNVETPSSELSQSSSQANSGNEGGRIFASPLAKKLAEDKGIDLSKVTGSGDNGRIIKKDIENYKPAAEAAQVPSAGVTSAPMVSAGITKKVTNSQMRKVIARRLSESKFTAPHYYLNIEVNMDNAIEVRKRINSLPDTKISFNDMVVKAAAFALRKHPQVNSSWQGDDTVLHGDINIGVAVAVEDGLLVPVVKNADHKGFMQISGEVKDLAVRARDRKLKADEMEGSTFSISNLGMFGIESFTSIINQPNSCILSVGAIVEKPIVKDGQIVPGNTMKLSLACDHRTVDGATGAEFLQTLRTYIEQPEAMLV